MVAGDDATGPPSPPKPVAPCPWTALQHGPFGAVHPTARLSACKSRSAPSIRRLTSTQPLVLQECTLRLNRRSRFKYSQLSPDKTGRARERTVIQIAGAHRRAQSASRARHMSPVCSVI